MRYQPVFTFLVSTLVVAGSAFAQTPAAAAPQTPAPAPAAAAQPADTPKRATLTVGSDFTSAYMFRGIFQADHGAIIQPVVDLGVALGRGLSLNVGNWESQHSSLDGTFYESDYYVSLTATVGKWKPGVLHTSYTSPKDAFKTVHEIAGMLAYDDSASALPFSPKVILAQEFSEGQADGGAGKGTYLELGVRPTVKVIRTATPLNLAIPVKLGLGLKDYYEGPTGANTFGYFDVGFIGSVPISLSKGTFEIHGGVDFLRLGDNLTLLNGGDHVKPVLSVGFAYTY